MAPLSFLILAPLTPAGPAAGRKPPRWMWQSDEKGVPAPVSRDAQRIHPSSDGRFLKEDVRR